MDDSTRRAAARLDRLAKRVEIGVALFVGILLTIAGSIALLYFLLVVLWNVSGSGGSGGSD